MNRHHEDVLADIERRVRTEGASLDEVDARLAAELGVPAEYYFAYLLVWGAIEAYQHTHTMTDADWAGDRIPTNETLARCRGVVDRVGWLAARIYANAVDLGPLGADITDHSGKLFGAVLELRRDLSLLDAECDPTASRCGPGDGQAVRS